MTDRPWIKKWLFLKPWFVALQNRIDDSVLECEEVAWDVQRRHLHVSIPSRKDDILDEKGAGNFKFPTEAKFQANAQKARETLLLLAAVQHVDQWAVKYLLGNYCQVEMGEEGEEMSEEDNEASFVLFVDMESGENFDFDSDLVQLCRVSANGQPSENFVEALAKIAAMGTKLQPDKPGVEIEVPVRVYFSIQNRKFTKSAMEVLEDVIKAEKVIKEDWEKFTQISGNENPAPKSLRCRFVLEPMIADFDTLTVAAKLAETMDRLLSVFLACH